MPAPTYLSLVEFPGDGTTTVWDFNFAGGYISRSHVKAFIRSPSGLTTPHTIVDADFVTDFRLTVLPAVPVGYTLRIYRETPKDAPLTNFAGGSNFTEANLDLLAQQAVFATAEAYDAGDYARSGDLIGVATDAAERAEAAAEAVDLGALEAAVSASAGSADAAADAAEASIAAASILAGMSGAVMYFARNTAPAGWLKANGAVVSRTTYAALFAAIGTTFGAGDGSTTFGLPDLRGEFARGWDDARGVDTGRAFGSAQTDLIKTHTHEVNISPIAVGGALSSGQATFGATRSGGYYGTVSMTEGGVETRPRNIALLACIKT